MDEYLLIFFLGIIFYFLTKRIFSNTINSKFKSINNNIANYKKTFQKTSEELLREQLKRNYEFFEEKGMNLIRNSTIIIFGLDGIGSNIALTLIRSGIKKLIIIDNNILTNEFFSSHPCSFLSDLGKKNIDIIDYYGKKINPNIIIEKYESINDNLFNLILKENEKENKINLIIDTILTRKNIIDKCKIIKFCSDNKLNLIISLFPQLEKYNPIYIRQSKFSFVQNDIIAKAINKTYIKLYNTIVPDFKTIYSIEKDENLDLEKLPELNPVYSNFSNTICAIVLCQISKFKFENNLNENNKKNIDKEIMIGNKKLSKLIEDYKKDEIEKKNMKKEDIKITYDDFKTIALKFKNMSSVSKKQGAKMQFIRWKLYEQPSKNNLVILTKNEISKHINVHNEEELINLYGKENVDKINNILNEIK